MTRYLNFWEALSVGVNRGVFDVGTLDALAGGIILSIWRNYEPWIQSRRVLYASSVFQELERLARDIAHRRGETLNTD